MAHIKGNVLELTPDIAAELSEGLDSLIYWQLSDEQYRHNGFVNDPGSDDPEQQKRIKEAEALIEELDRWRAAANAKGDG